MCVSTFPSLSLFFFNFSCFKEDRSFLDVPLETLKEAKKAVVTAVNYNPNFISNLLLKKESHFLEKTPNLQG